MKYKKNLHRSVLRLCRKSNYIIQQINTSTCKTKYQVRKSDYIPFIKISYIKNKGHRNKMQIIEFNSYVYYRMNVTPGSNIMKPLKTKFPKTLAYFIMQNSFLIKHIKK